MAHLLERMGQVVREMQIEPEMDSGLAAEILREGGTLERRGVAREEPAARGVPQEARGVAVILEAGADEASCRRQSGLKIDGGVSREKRPDKTTLIQARVGLGFTRTSEAYGRRDPQSVYRGSPPPYGAGISPEAHEVALEIAAGNREVRVERKEKGLVHFSGGKEVEKTDASGHRTSYNSRWERDEETIEVATDDPEALLKEEKYTKQLKRRGPFGIIVVGEEQSTFVVPQDRRRL